jgi:NAD(P)-dependent dehydrogenase (short-subunit alcohol dehydrogenase family)
MTHLVLNEELARTALRDKVVVLTGGSTGIGRAAVEMFAGM